jgi:hypothetical protein
LKLLVTWLDDWLPLSSRAHSSLNVSNVSRPPNSARSETVLQLLLGRTCGDYLRSLKALTPHQRKIFRLITQSRNQQLFQWNIVRGLVVAPRMVSSTMADTSPTSSSQNQVDEPLVLLDSSPLPLSVTPPATLSTLRGPPTGPSSTPSHSMRSRSNQLDPSTLSRPGFSPYSIQRPHITTSSSRQRTETVTGGLLASWNATGSTPFRCIEPRRGSTDGRQKSKHSTLAAIAVASASNEHEPALASKPFNTSRTSRMSTHGGTSRPPFSPNP